MKSVIIILIIFAVIFWLILKLTKELRKRPIAKEKLADLERTFADLKSAFHEATQYLRFSKILPYMKEIAKLKKQASELRATLIRTEAKKLMDELETFESNLIVLRESVNDRFFREEKARARHIFGDNGNDLLTDEQLRAVLCNDDRNLVIAGAGSGKTRVIDFKVRYLVNYKNISPAKILLLSFSRKSANDLVKKISENIPGIEARTIHSFGSQVTGKQPRKLFDESHREFESLVIKALVQTLKESGVYRLFEEFYEKFFSDIKPLIFYKSLNELRKDLGKLNSKLIDIPDRFGEIKARRALKTLKGDYVRSVDERYIADFLFLQDIKYEYEMRYPYADESYYPDFYLPDYDIYLEHFAITSSGRPPPYFDNPQKYMDGIQWKRDLHKEQKTRMIESYSYLLNARQTSIYLTELFTENGIEVHDLNEEKAYSKISQEFCRVFTKFYRSFKLSGLSLQELKQRHTERKYSLFLQLFERFFGHFEEMAAAENRMDFDDMIIGAIDKYKEDAGRRYDYIIVDEFQDTSNLAMKLLDEVYQSNPEATLLSVGDDWQSIYGFNGSDVTILSGYTKRYPGVSVQVLNDNFRSHSKIVELGKQFISKNPTQIPKNVVSRNNKFKDSKIGFLTFEQMEEKIKDIPANESVFVLYRYNDDRPEAFGVFNGRSKNISMMTIHASKGLEAQHVFVLFPDGVRRKFPSEIEDHFVFNMLKTNSDDFPFSEERRLMYVAITRAEQNLYFVSPTDKDPNSVFWDELKELAQKVSKRDS